MKFRFKVWFHENCSMNIRVSSIYVQTEHRSDSTIMNEITTHETNECIEYE